jgi:hypothetical protein
MLAVEVDRVKGKMERVRELLSMEAGMLIIGIEESFCP